MKKSTDRLTIPTDVDVVEGILRPMKLWEADAALHRWFSRNQNVDVHACVENGFWCAVNNTHEPQDTVIDLGDGTQKELRLEPNGIYWFDI